MTLAEGSSAREGLGSLSLQFGLLFGDSNMSLYPFILDYLGLSVFTKDSIISVDQTI